MALVQAICDNCGGILNVDPSLKRANCPHCGTSYLVQDVINIYNTYNNIEHLHAGTVNTGSRVSIDSLIEAGNAFVKIGDFQSAYYKYRKATDEAPQDYRGWWGMIICNTKHFSTYTTQLYDCTQYFRNVEMFAPINVIESLRRMWQNYYDEASVEYVENPRIKQDISVCENRVQDMCREEQSLRQKKYNVEQNRPSLGPFLYVSPLFLIGVITFIFSSIKKYPLMMMIPGLVCLIYFFVGRAAWRAEESDIMTRLESLLRAKDNQQKLIQYLKDEAIRDKQEFENRREERIRARRVAQ